MKRRKLRRSLLSFVLTMVLAFSCLPSVGAEEMIYFEPAEYGESIRFLEKLQILNEEELAAGQLENWVSRGEFAKLVLAMLGVQKNLGTDEWQSRFADVKPEHPYAAWIHSAVELGVFASGRNFRPDEPVIYDEALKVMVTLLGYGVHADELGGYPLGYRTIANRKELLSETSYYGNEVIPRGMLYVLMADVITTDMLIPNGFGDRYSFGVYEGRNLMTEYLHIFKGEGVVEADYMTALAGNTARQPNELIIGGKRFEVDPVYVPESVGKRWRYYYRENADGTKEIVYIVQKDTTVVVLDAGEIVDYDGGYVSWVNGKQKLYRTKLTAPIVYNGKLLEASEDEKLIPQAGNVRLIDNDDDSVYDVVIVNAFRNMVVGRLDLLNGKIFNENGKNPIPFSDYQYAELLNSAGERIQLDALQEGNILTVYESEGMYALRGILSAETVAGKLTKQDQEANELWIDDDQYSLSQALLLDPGELTVGQEYIFCLDAMGRICAQKGESFLSAGYILKWGEPGIFSGECPVKLLSSSGRVEELLMAEKLTVQTIEGICTMKAAEFAEQQSLYQGLLVQFTKDSKGRIRRITLPYLCSNAEEKITYPLIRADYVISDWPEYLCEGVGEDRKGVYKTANQTISNWLYLSDQTSIFFVPEHEEDIYNEKELSVRRAGTIFNDDQRIPLGKMDVYKTDNSEMKPSYIVYHQLMQTEVSSDGFMNLVTEISQTIHPETGGLTYQIQVLSSGEEKYYYLKESELLEDIDLGKGDLIRFQTDNRGVVSQILLDYDYSKEQPYGATDWNNRLRVASGFVGRVSDGMVEVIMRDSGIAELFRVTGGRILIYDSFAERGFMGTEKDIVPGDRIVLHTRYGGVRTIVIYKGEER